MEFHPKFSCADCDCLQTCLNMLDFCVKLCYYEFGNAQYPHRGSRRFVLPEAAAVRNQSELVQSGKVPPADSPRTNRLRTRLSRMTRTSSGYAAHRKETCRRRAVKVKEFPASARRTQFCMMQQQSQHPALKDEPACMEPVPQSKHRSLSKTHPCSAANRPPSPADGRPADPEAKMPPQACRCGSSAGRPAGNCFFIHQHRQNPGAHPPDRRRSAADRAPSRKTEHRLPFRCAGIPPPRSLLLYTFPCAPSRRRFRKSVQNRARLLETA